MEYASNAKANAALTTGIIGTSLGALSSAGGLAGILGVGQRNNPPMDPGDKPVTRYEMGLIKEISDKNDEIVLLKAAQYSDSKDDILQAQIQEQAVWTSAATVTMANLGQQIQKLFGITQLMVPDWLITPAIQKSSGATTTSSGD